LVPSAGIGAHDEEHAWAVPDDASKGNTES
jgi:hypothetical protein